MARKKKGRRKHLSAAHRRAISRGLRRRYRLEGGKRRRRGGKKRRRGK